jgi:hypothetical protein
MKVKRKSFALAKPGGTWYVAKQCASLLVDRYGINLNQNHLLDLAKGEMGFLMLPDKKKGSKYIPSDPVMVISDKGLKMVIKNSFNQKKQE